MTQALFSAMTGLNAGTEQLTVVSDNVANMNTTAYKTSRVDFQDIWYATKTTGTNSTQVSGGTNPYQVGVGVQCASITKDYTAASTNTTGRAEDMAITGDGWFTVLNSDGKVLLTRDGTFSLDENGFLCTADGSKVLGMDYLESLNSSTTPIRIPTSIKVVEDGTPKENFDTLKVDQLNALNSATAGFTPGSFTVTVYDEKGNIAEDKLEIKIPANYDFDDPDTHDISEMTMAQIAQCIEDQADGHFTVDTGAGIFIFDPAQTGYTLKFHTVNEGKGGSNFVSATNIANVAMEGGVYKTPILSMKATIGEVDDISSEYTHNFEDFSVGKDGLITVTYGDGSILTDKANENGSTYFSYQDANGIIINDDTNKSLTVDPNVLKLSNMQLQLAKVLNNGGLVAEGNNQYSVGVNCGTVIYSAANVNGIGGVVSGALESSNVDLAQQFSNMILAQRLVQANSQVFSGANQLLETLVYLGN